MIDGCVLEPGADVAGEEQIEYATRTYGMHALEVGELAIIGRSYFST